MPLQITKEQCAKWNARKSFSSSQTDRVDKYEKARDTLVARDSKSTLHALSTESFRVQTQIASRFEFSVFLACLHRKQKNNVGFTFSTPNSEKLWFHMRSTYQYSFQVKRMADISWLLIPFQVKVSFYRCWKHSWKTRTGRTFRRNFSTSQKRRGSIALASALSLIKNGAENCKMVYRRTK